MDIHIQNELEKIKNIIIETVPVERIYLFGSYAVGNPNSESDLDLYILMPENSELREIDAMRLIYKAIRDKKTMPVDVVVGKVKNFNLRKSAPTIERTIPQEGLCYMDNISSAKEWFTLAEMDLQSAEYLTSMCPVPIEIICYHCQQSAEKFLKGFLVQNGINPPKTHDLNELNKLCMKNSPAYSSINDLCSDLTAYGVQPRYPTSLSLNEEDMKQALSGAKTICDFVSNSYLKN